MPEATQLAQITALEDQRRESNMRIRIGTAVGAVLLGIPTVGVFGSVLASSNNTISQAERSQAAATAAYDEYLASQPEACQMILTDYSGPQQTLPERIQAIQDSRLCGPNSTDIVLKHNQLIKAKNSKTTEVHTVQGEQFVYMFNGTIAGLIALGVGAAFGNIAAYKSLPEDKKPSNIDNRLKQLQKFKSETALEAAVENINQPTLPLEKPEGYEPTDDELAAIDIVSGIAEAHKPQFPLYIAAKAAQQ